MGANVIMIMIMIMDLEGLTEEYNAVIRSSRGQFGVPVGNKILVLVVSLFMS